MKVVEKHPFWLRCLHWLNVPLFLLMIWSGLLIYWANDVYPGFFPQWFYDLFKMNFRLAEGLAIHFAVAWAFVLTGLVYTVYLFRTGHAKELAPRVKAPAHGLFSAAQRVAYTGVLAVAALEVLSGFAIHKPVQLQWLTRLLGGYETARLIHFVCMLVLSAFFFVHVLQVIRAGWNTFRAMVAGFEVRK